MALDFHELERRHEAAASTEVSARAGDAALVRAFQTGDPLAFPAIYERYRPLARHIAFRILRSPEEADETSQETMLRVYQGLHRFEGELRLQAWVARIAANLALDAARARSRRPARADRPVEEVAHSLPDPAQDPEALVARMLEDAEVRRVLATLPPHHRDALVMREFEGRSHAEIGTALGVSAPQAKALLHRARRSFRRAWEAAGQGVAGLVPVLLWPLRRFTDQAAEAASAAAHGAQVAQTAPTLYLVPQVAQVAATSGVGERIAAAGMAVLVAAGVGAGAVAVKDRIDRPEPRVAAVAAAPAPADGGSDAAATAATSDASVTSDPDASVASADGASATIVDGTSLGTEGGSAPDGTSSSDVVAIPPGPAFMLRTVAPLVGCEGCEIAWSLASGDEATAPLDGDAHLVFGFVGTVTGPEGSGAEGWSAQAVLTGDLSGGEGFTNLEVAVTSPSGVSTWTGKTYASVDGVTLVLEKADLVGPEGSALTTFGGTLYFDPGLSVLRGALLSLG